MKFSNTTGQQSSYNSKGILRGGSLVAGIEVSVILSENHTYSAQATKTALEDGTEVSDHVIVDPESVSISFEMSNSANGIENARDVLETFRNMLFSRVQLELTTDHMIYEDMVITNVSASEQAPFKGKLMCDVSLQKINVIQLETVGRAPSQLSGSAEATASTEVDGGTQQGEQVRQSYLSKIAENASGGQ